MKKKVRFGILGTAIIARESMIAALHASSLCEPVALASRDPEKAREWASRTDVPKYYSSYEKLLEDPQVEAVYIPLPNHLHLPWTLKALKAGKHVLCEKPLTTHVEEALLLLEELSLHPGLKVMEGGMYRFHPQWQTARKMVLEGSLGKLRNVVSLFAFYDDDPRSIVNRKDYGGGALLDIGYYNVSLARFLFDEEPLSVMGEVSYDASSGIDITSTGVMRFTGGTSAFTCSIRMNDEQHVRILGEKGTLVMERPFNPSPDQVQQLLLITSEGNREIRIPPADQYARMADAFARAILENKPVPLPLEDAVNNLRVLAAVPESAKEGKRILLR